MTYQTFFVVKGDGGIRMVDAIMKSECGRKTVSCTHVHLSRKCQTNVRTDDGRWNFIRSFPGRQ